LINVLNGNKIVFKGKTRKKEPKDPREASTGKVQGEDISDDKLIAEGREQDAGKGGEEMVKI